MYFCRLAVNKSCS